MEKNLFIRPFVVSEEWQTFINFEIGSFDFFNGEYAHRNYVFNDVVVIYNIEGDICRRKKK